MRATLDKPREQIIEETIRFVKAEKREGITWDQDYYYFLNQEQSTDSLKPVDCGTSMCVAGWAAHSAGYVPRLEGFVSGWSRLEGWSRPSGKNVHDTEDLAGSILGLRDHRHRSYLFSEHRTKREVLKALRHLQKHGSLTGLKVYGGEVMA